MERNMESKNYYQTKTSGVKVDTLSDVDTNYIIKISLTNFFAADVIEHEDAEGDVVKGVFIPIDKNDLRLGKNNSVSAYAFVNRCTLTGQKYDYWTHYFRLKTSNAFASKMKSLGKKMPYLGNMKKSRWIFNKSAYDKSLVKKSDYEQE